MVGGEITAVVGIKCQRNTTDMPLREQLAPDGLTEHQSCLYRRGRMKTDPKPRNGAAVVIHNDGEPGPRRRPTVLLHPEIHEGVVGLPDVIRPLCFAAIKQIKGGAIGFTPGMR